MSVTASTLSPLLAANTVTLSLFFYRTFQETAYLTGYHLLAVGLSGLLFVPSARVWGKRHLYLLGTVVVIFSSVWCGASTNSYTSLLWARVFQGIGLAPFEALVNASVGDLYCVHQRGKRMALSNLALFGGAFFTPVLVGKITHDIGWQWTFYLIAIIAGGFLPAVVFYLPEMAYKRDETPPGGPHVEGGGEEKGAKHVSYPPKASYWQSLKPFNGRKTDEGYWNLFFRPFPLFLHPAVFWVSLSEKPLGWTIR